MNAIVIDIEGDNLYPYQTQTWTICLRRVGGESLTLNPFRSTKSIVKQQILDFVFKRSEPIIVGHNYLGFDGWVLWKDFDLELHVGKDTLCGRPVRYYDTLFASQFLFPDREGGHSLESWGIRLGKHKISYRKIALELNIIQPHESEFCRWSPQMDEYCEQDVVVTEDVFLELFPQTELTPDAFKLGQKNFYLMSAQEFTGFKFDLNAAIDLKERIGEMITTLKDEVEPALPKRALKKAEESFYTIPSKPFLKTGGFSATMANFIQRHNATTVYPNKIRIDDKDFDIVPGTRVIDGLPMSLSDQKELKDYFLSIKWEPTMWNLKKDSSGRPIREKGKVVFTSPKIQENGKICENLLTLDGELPKKIVKFLSLRNRQSVITGWLENNRLKFDGRLPPGSTGIASTHRQKHIVIVNVPKSQDDVLLGKEFRSLFVVDNGNKLIGVDQAALEARCEGHWTFPFDNGQRASLLIDKDIHSHNTRIFFPEETKQFDINSPDFDKGHPEFKPYRSLSKNGGYCLAYGGQPAKLAKTLRKDEKDGKLLYDAYWDANPSLKKLKDKIEYEWERNGEKKWIIGIDGRKLYSRSKHSLVNLLFQSTGAIIVDYALCLFDMKMGRMYLDELGRPYYKYKGKIAKRVGYYHDEALIESNSEIAEEIAKIMEWSMVEAGVRLKLNVPLVGESKIGLNWRDTH